MRRTTGLRLRLSAALVAVAALAVGIATVVSIAGLEPRLTDAAAARIAASGDRLAEIAAARYRDNGGWSGRVISDLEHLALTNGLALAIVRPNGRRLGSGADGVELEEVSGGPGAIERPVVARGTLVGTIRAAPVGGSLLSPEEIDLREELDRLHLIAGAIAVGLALVAALLLAQAISAPLRRIRTAAHRMERGELETRVGGGGGTEVESVGHALNRLAETLQHEEELRKASVADLAHELRTPVGGLLARIEAAQDGVLADRRSNLDAMHAETVRLARLLDDLTALAEAERPGLLLDKHRLDLAAVAAAEVEQMKHDFATRGISLEVDLAPAPVLGDRDRLGQIIANLLSNAARYTDSGGRVIVRVAREGDRAVLELSDTGIGIAADDLEHIFKRFWRADRSRSRETGGTGVGLAIVRELVIAHDGRIDVQSVPGVGSSFRVTLPCVSSVDPGEATRPKAPEVASGAS
jgi:two-component system, OmpR family, sensor histidine kinase BaeS